MNPKEKRDFLLLRRRLQETSFESYLKLLSSLLRNHKEYTFLTGLAGALRRRDYKSVYSEADRLSSQKYEDATSHFVANQFALLIKKYPWPVKALDLKPQERATATFWAAERRARRVNVKFSLLSGHRSRDRLLDEARVARAWIRSTIGERPNYEHIFKKSDFGSGASVGVHGNATHILAKLHSEKWSVTPGALHHGFGCIMHNFHFVEQLLDRGDSGIVCLDYTKAFEAYVRRTHVVRSNKISFVPKTAKTLRTIAVEPLANGLVQKGIDLVLREKLRRVGIDLSSQGLNQEMARKGSLDDSDDAFVTIDLSSASDSISTELVRYLFPDSWFRLLDRTRSQYFNLDGDEHRYHKLCSMGNGFCFPIETLLFGAACAATGSGEPGVDFMVYGDDIVVRKRHAANVLKLLAHWGFKVNAEKTYLDGPFRESCGSDWFGGEDVRPFTLDYALDSLESVFKFLNLTRRNANTSRFFAPIRESIMKMVPEQFQFIRPLPGNSDTGIDSSGDEHLYSANCRFVPARNAWSWRELHHEPVIDVSRLELVRDQPWLIGIALRGTMSIPHGRLTGLPGVTFRKQTRTKIVRKGYSSTSNWLPTPR